MARVRIEQFEKAHLRLAFIGSMWEDKMRNDSIAVKKMCLWGLLSLEVLAGMVFVWSARIWGSWVKTGLDDFAGSPDAALNAGRSHSFAVWSERALFLTWLISTAWLVAYFASKTFRKVPRLLAASVLATPLLVFAVTWLTDSFPLPAWSDIHSGQRISFVTRAAYADSRLWLLTDNGTVSSVSLTQNDLRSESLPGHAGDLCLIDGHPMAITGAGKAATVWTLHRKANSGWTTVATIPVDGDELLGMACGPTTITILTTRRLVDLDDKAQRVIQLSGAIGRGLISSMYLTPNHLFVGIDAGEWGGGLRRIDRHSGKVLSIEGPAGTSACEGPLSTSCDPVNAIVAEPGKSGCLVAAVGLVHLGQTGRLVEVCGDRVRQLYQKTFWEQVPDPSRQRRGVQGSIAFFALRAKGDTILAVGSDGVYSLGPTGPQIFTPLPVFQSIGGVQVSQKQTDLMLIMTAVNERHSVSGSVPMLVMRE